MVQLSSRQHGGGREPIRLADVLTRIAETFQPVAGIETVPIGAAGAKFLATDLVATANVPAADQSAVDGYAFRHADLAGLKGRPFKLVGTSAAGHPLSRMLGVGDAARILTGAAIPAGADTVAMQEWVSISSEGVRVPADMRLGENCRPAGEDVAVGDVVLAAGRRLGPVEIGMLAALGMAQVGVRAALRVAVFSTGDELAHPGAVLGPGQRYDSNRPALLAMLGDLGMAATDLGILPDRAQAIEAALKHAAGKFDAILGSAGMSVGDEDHMRPVVERLGALDFWDVAIKPGRPVAAGRIGQTPFFGLPGNPAAALVTFLMIVRPALVRLAGGLAPEPRRFPVRLGFTLARKAGRREFLRCTLLAGEGYPVARRMARDGSAILSAVAACDGFVEAAEAVGDLEPGMILPFIPKSEFGLWGPPASF